MLDLGPDTAQIFMLVLDSATKYFFFNEFLTPGFLHFFQELLFAVLRLKLNVSVYCL